MAEILFVCGGGIGNIVQSLPAIHAASKEGHVIDLLILCNTPCDLSIFDTNYVRTVYGRRTTPKGNYEYQLEGNLFLKKGEKSPVYAKVIRSRVRYSRHHPEAEYYYDIVQQIGVTTPMEDSQINVGKKGFGPFGPHRNYTVAIFPGSKPNWAMKRWDKYDDLARKFIELNWDVSLVGTSSDLYSTGKPTWIKKKWDWPTCHHKLDSLQAVAHYISKCKIFVGNDGGLAHVAAATGIPTFVLFGPSSVEKNLPFSSKAKAIAIDLPCRPCQYKEGQQFLLPGKANCPFNMKCMRDMSVDYVLDCIKREISL